MSHKRPTGMIHYSPPLDIVLRYVNPFHPLLLRSILYYQFQYCLPIYATILISAMRAKCPVHRIRPHSQRVIWVRDRLETLRNPKLANHPLPPFETRS